MPCLCSALHLVVEAPQRLACTNASDSYLVVPYSSPKASHHDSIQINPQADLHVGLSERNPPWPVNHQHPAGSSLSKCVATC